MCFASDTSPDAACEGLYNFAAGESECNRRMCRFAKTLIHGNCHDRWFDKSISLTVLPNGQVGWNFEHSLADALVCHPMLSPFSSPFSIYFSFIYPKAFLIHWALFTSCNDKNLSFSPFPYKERKLVMFK